MTTVLVVDDEPDLCDLIRVNLELAGHRVIIANDGDAGLRAARELAPDVIVLDVMMPGRDGFAVLEEIKAGRGGRVDVPVIMLTARADAVDRIRGGLEGAVHYLTKPFSSAALRAAVLDAVTEPEVERRQAVQRESLAALARLESGRGVATAVRPHLTRYEARERTPPRPAPPEDPMAVIGSVCTERQRHLVEVVLAQPDVRSAADVLGVSRTYLYASLRRIARHVGLDSGPALLRSLRDSTAGGRS